MNKKAFTLIEMIIAIAVFSVGVLTILNLLINNLYFLDKASTKTQASFLAKEGIELVYNLRDSNLVKSYPRNCIPKIDFSKYNEKIDPNKPISYCLAFLGSGDYTNQAVFSLGFSPTEYFTIGEVSDTLETDWKTRFEKYKIVAETGFSDIEKYEIYSQDSNSEKNTKFARYIITKPLVEGDATISTENILKLESHVLYKNGTKTGEVIFESFIGNY